MFDSSPGERLTDIIFANKMSKKDFAESLGYNPSYITQICKNLKPPSAELAAKVERRYGVSADWLVHGAAPGAFAVSETPSVLREAVLSRVGRIGSEHELRAVLAFINSYEELSAPARKTRPKRARPRLYTIPVKGEVAGGLPIIAYEKRGESIESALACDSALYIRGKSMEPDYPDGSLLLIKENAYVSNGDVVVALIMKEAEVAEATCKVFRRRGDEISLLPLNPDFAPQLYRKSEGYEIKIYGKVIGSAKA